MPGVSGVEAAHIIGRRAHLVFVTAYDQYAVQAFAEGVLDYWSSRSSRRGWPRPLRA
jgi:DNA-binding LytR/AlgR family response regulator